MKILRNYLLREFAGPFFMSLGVLTFTIVVVGNLRRIADLVINRGIDIFSVMKLLILMTPYMITYALPISLLIAVLLALGRLSGDNEIIAIRASGVNILRLFLPLFMIGLILSLGLMLFNDRAASYAHYAYRKTLIEIGIKNPTAALEEGVFINSFEKYVLFIYKVDQKKNKLYNIRVYEPQGDDKPTRTIIAKSGEFIPVPEKGIIKLKLTDGTSDEPDPDNPRNFFKLNFKTYFMNLNLAETRKGGKIEKKPKEMSFRELKEEIKKLTREKVDPSPLLTELNEKITLSFSCLVFMLLGAPLAMMTRRREKSINIGMALLVIVLYYPLVIGCEALGMQGAIDPALIMWAPNIIFGTAGVILTYKICAS